MKKHSVIQFFLILAIFSLIVFDKTSGQDYQTINSKRIAYFDDQYNNINCIRIDSVKYQTDSVMYPFTVIQQLDYDCYSPIIASWIGKKVVINEFGNNYFFNKNNDTIAVNTGAKLGEKWILFKITDSLIIEATVINHDTLTFLGFNDSVKTIGFQTYDKSMNPLDLEINEMNIQISKNYGFVKTLNFYLFPYFQVDYPYEQCEEYDLIGLSYPKVGIQNLTWIDVNDFQVGDELHILDESSCWIGDGYGSAITKKTIYKYLERTDYSDSIVYHYSRKQSIYTTWADSSTFKFYNDTLESIIKPDLLFDKLPGEPIGTEHETYSYYMTNVTPLSKTNSSSYESFVFIGDSCWQMIIADGCLTDDEYIKGLGGPYYSCTQAFCLGGEERKLVYYKKGEITWGNPLVVTGISEKNIISNIKVYPNPSDYYINVSIDDNKHSNYSIYIYDIQGRLQKSIKLELNNSKIDISDLFTGIYILKITDNENILKLDKLIIK